MIEVRQHTMADGPRPRRAPEQSVPVSAAVRVKAGRARRGRGTAAALPGAAVVKVAPYRHSVHEVMTTLRYVLDKADRAEDDGAVAVEASPKELAAGWSMQDGDGRLAAHLMFSLPNQDPEAEWKAARQAIRTCFADSPYICALHTDTEQPHVHVVVRVRDYSGKKLRIGRDTLHEYREALAKAGRELGIAVEARRYDVPTRARCRLRVFSEREPMARQLDRHIAVLQKPAEVTPSQMRAACRALRRHHGEMHDGHRRGVMRAVATLEQYPTMERQARALCRLAYKGPRGDRFAVRQRQREDIRSLGPAPEAQPVTQAPPKRDKARERQAQRALKRTLKLVKRRELLQPERDQLRAQVGHLAPQDAVRVERALERTITDVERERMAAAQRRAKVEAALATLQVDASKREANRAIRQLARHRKELRLGDRLTLRQQVIPRLSQDPDRAKQVRALHALAKRPRTLGQAVKDAANTVAATVAATVQRVISNDGEHHDPTAPRVADGAPRTQSPQSPELRAADRAPRTPRESIEHALGTLASSSAGESAVTRQALRSLREHREVMTSEHHRRLLDQAREWPAGAPVAEASRIVRSSGEHGRAVHGRYQLDRAIETLKTPPAEDAAATRRALWTVRRQREHLTDAHRERLLEHVQRWPAGANMAERAASAVYERVAARLVRSGDAGRAFCEQARIAKALETLAARTPAPPPAPPAEVKPPAPVVRPEVIALNAQQRAEARAHEAQRQAQARAERASRPPPRPAPEAKQAVIVLRKDIIALNADERAQARAHAARLRADAYIDRATRHQAGKLLRAVDKTASNQERAQVHLDRALVTVARLPEHVNRRELGHAIKAFRTLHPFLSREQREVAQHHANRLASHARYGKLARALERIDPLPPHGRTAPPAAPRDRSTPPAPPRDRSAPPTPPRDRSTPSPARDRTAPSPARDRTARAPARDRTAPAPARDRTSMDPRRR